MPGQLELIERYCLSLPGTTMVVQWGENHVYKVGGKLFALAGPDAREPGVTFKVTEDSFTILTRLGGIAQAPYFAKRQWVHVERIRVLPRAELKAYIKRSYDMIAAKLTRKQRAELGVERSHP